MHAHVVYFTPLNRYRAKWCTFKADKNNSIIVQVWCRSLTHAGIYGQRLPAKNQYLHPLQSVDQSRRDRRQCKENGVDPTAMDVDSSDLTSRSRRRSYDPTRVRVTHCRPTPLSYLGLPVVFVATCVDQTWLSGPAVAGQPAAEATMPVLLRAVGSQVTKPRQHVVCRRNWATRTGATPYLSHT